jgi:hypothetical protein
MALRKYDAPLLFYKTKLGMIPMQPVRPTPLQPQQQTQRSAAPTAAAAEGLLTADDSACAFEGSCTFTKHIPVFTYNC